MFVLTKLEDVVCLEPHTLGKNTSDALQHEINKKYSNRVLHDVGLFICLFDIESMGDGQTRFGDGSVYVKTVFRMIVFRPFVGEVLVGWVASCSAEGIKVKTDFFDSIQIPHAMLWDTCEFVADEQAWKWKSDGGDLFIDQNEKIRFRVEKEVFQVAKPEEGVSPYTIIGSCQQDGMGLVAWWQ